VKSTGKEEETDDNWKHKKSTQKTELPKVVDMLNNFSSKNIDV
jgi:hypothetical protein